MDYWCETDWYAVQCKLHHEKLAVARVAKLEVEVFFPKIVQGQGVSGESRSPTAIVSRLFFCALCPAISFDAVRTPAASFECW